MLKEVPLELIEFIKSYDTFFVIGHEEPDGDCLGAQTALSSFLTRTGKTAALCSAGPFIRPETNEIEHLFKPSLAEAAEAMNLPAHWREGSDFGVIIVDCSTPERIGPGLSEEIQGLPCAVIDHHASGKPFGTPVFINGESPSTTILVYQLIKAMGEKPVPAEAEHLLFGFLTDTGFFRHLDSSNADSMKLAAELMEYGSSLKDLYFRMYGGRSLQSKILTGRVLSRAEPLFEGRCILIYETLEEKNRFGQDNRDSDTIYSQLLAVKGCEAVIFIREESKDKCSVSLRSLHDIDVGSVASAFGGGGHKRAAGFEWNGSRKIAEEKIRTAFAEIFTE